MENPTKRPFLEGPSAPKTFFSLPEPKCVLKRTYIILAQQLFTILKIFKLKCNEVRLKLLFS